MTDAERLWQAAVALYAGPLNFNVVDACEFAEELVSEWRRRVGEEAPRDQRAVLPLIEKWKEQDEAVAAAVAAERERIADCLFSEADFQSRGGNLHTADILRLHAAAIRRGGAQEQP